VAFFVNAVVFTAIFAVKADQKEKSRRNAATGAAIWLAVIAVYALLAGIVVVLSRITWCCGRMPRVREAEDVSEVDVDVR